MTTLQDVAKRAGVAPITVSRVINRSGYATQEMRDRVEEAAAELGYIPNSLARSLRSKRTHTLALVLTDLANPFFTTVARGVEDAASDAGYMVIVCNTDESQSDEQKYLRMLMQKQVDGILLVPARNSEDSIRALQQQGTIVVILDRRVKSALVDVVRCDSEDGAYQLGRLLASLGHRRAAVLAGPKEVSTAEDRVVGFCRAFREKAVEDVPRVHYGALTLESGYALAQKALTCDPRPTALFATNNFLAIGALKALHASGLRVPEDVALVGFDDLPPDLVTFPFFTVAAQSAYEMGQRAMALMLDRLNGCAPEAFQEVILPTEIIIRRSSGGHIA